MPLSYLEVNYTLDKKKRKKAIPHLPVHETLIIPVVCKILLSIELHLLLSPMYHCITSMIILAERGSSIVNTPTCKSYSSRYCRDLLRYVLINLTLPYPLFLS